MTWSVAVGSRVEILFRAVIGQHPVLKLGVMAASFPLQLLCSAFDFIAGRLFADNPKNLCFRHSWSKLGKSVVHLTTEAQQKREGN